MPNSSIEAAFCDALQAAGTDYEQAVHTVKTIVQQIADGRGQVHAYDRLEQIARRTRQTETNVTRLREDFVRHGLRPGAQLQSVLRRQEVLLKNLIQSLDEAEHVARAAQGRMAPVVDGAMKSHQMHLAYARTVRQANE